MVDLTLMERITIHIDGTPVETHRGSSVLHAAEQAGIYIPRLCSHPSLVPGRGYSSTSEDVYRGSQHCTGSPGVYEGCGLCLVRVEGEAGLQHACALTVRAEMRVITDDEETRRERQARLRRLLSVHPHACLTCGQREGCPRTQCSSNVPVEERCCSKFGDCEIQKVADHVGIPKDTPRYIPRGIPRFESGPMFTWDFELCVGCLRCVRACRDLRGVGALTVTFSEGDALVGWEDPERSGCMFCGACVEVCPTGTILDLEKVNGSKAPCVSACPLEMDVPGYLRGIAGRRYDDAARIIRAYTPLPRSLGRVCFHPCEDACRRRALTRPLAICALKRFAMDVETSPALPQARDETGRRVAVIGSGPSGLSAAFHLRLKGHHVTLFEEGDELGGMLRMGIPGYRLPKDVLEKDIQEVLSLGMDVRTRTRLGRDISLTSLLSDGYDAVFLGVGSQLSKRIPLDGAEHPDVFWGLDFLRQVNSGSLPVLEGRRVLVIGGGNVAVDVALSARRCGAARVDIACLEKREEMPAFAWEIQQAEEEGVTIHNGWGPRRLISEDERLRGVEMLRCISVFDPEGRFDPKMDPSMRTTLEADVVILAVGQDTDMISLGDAPLKTGRGRLMVGPGSFATSMRGVFAGGEVVSGPSSVVRSIAEGRLAAQEIDIFLGGDGVLPPAPEGIPPDPRLHRREGFAAMERVEMPRLPPERRSASFDEIDLGYAENDAPVEASRCLQCDLRSMILPQVLPPEPWLETSDANIRTVPEAPGVLQILDRERNVLLIHGCMNMRESLTREVSSRPEARYFIWEAAEMYSQRESELISRHLQRFGRLPPGNDDLSELF